MKKLILVLVAVVFFGNNVYAAEMVETGKKVSSPEYVANESSENFIPDKDIAKFAKDFEKVVVYYQENKLYKITEFKDLELLFNRIKDNYKKYMNEKEFMRKEMYLQSWELAYDHLMGWLDIYAPLAKVSDKKFEKLLRFMTLVENHQPLYYR